MKSLRSLLAVGFLMGFCGVSPASATLTDAAAITASVGLTAGATVVGGPVAGLAVGGVSATVEGGYFLCVAIFGWGDPPDLVNYAVRASPALLIPNLPPDPTASLALNQASQEVIAGWSRVVQSLKGIQQSRDRLGGAQLVGTPADVANQQQWLREFTDEVRPRLQALAGPMGQYNALLAAEFPAYYDWNPTLAEAIQMRNDEAAGNFPSAEQSIIDAWELNAFKVGLVRNYIGGVSDATLAMHDDLTIGGGLSAIQDSCASGSCASSSASAPEPSSVAFLAMVLGAVCVGYGRFRVTLP